MATPSIRGTAIQRCLGATFIILAGLCRGYYNYGAEIKSDEIHQ